MAKKSTSSFDPMSNPFLDPKNNPFLDPEKNPFLKGDFAAMFKGFEAPDMESLAEAQRKNLEALTVANKTAAEGFQAVFTRQSELMKQAMDEANAALQDLSTKGPTTPDGKAQIEQVKGVIENAIGNTRELAELMAKSQSEAFDIVNKRFMESLDELKDAMGKVGK
jgi:phasin family protein